MASDERVAPFKALQRVLASHGVGFSLVPTPPTTVTQVSQELRLPPDFVDAYLPSGPASGSYAPWIVEQLIVYSFGELPGAQEGYAWSGPERSRLTGWAPNWVVVASVFGDPFFVDLEDEGLPVLFARHGAGEWKPRRVASNMTAFVEALSGLESVLLGDFRGDVFDADGLREDFARAVRSRLAATSNETDVANFMGTLE